MKTNKSNDNQNETSKTIEIDGKEVEYYETTTTEDDTIDIFVPNLVNKFDPKTIDEYKKSPQWKQLDEIYNKFLDIDKNEINHIDIIKEILSFGEIAFLKHSEVSLEIMEKVESGLPMEFIYLPFFFDMNPHQAIDLIDRRYSDDEETSIKASMEIDYLIKEDEINSMLIAIEEFVNNDNEENIILVAKKLFEKGDLALAPIKLRLIQKIKPQLEINLLIIALSIIYGNKDDALDLMKRLSNPDTEIFNKANEEVSKLINGINVDFYLNRHPKKLMEINQNIDTKIK
ncbi:MAG: hypothetical protein LBM96_09585 [Methanobrevibacter sp.]|jgi:hypothetical protein|nr:hypothetical protein [Candidatus Methanoflexus mossambicus]